MEKRTLRTVLLTVAALVLLLAVGALAFLYSGVYNVAATDPHSGLGAWALSVTKERSIAARADAVRDPPPMDSSDLRHGFVHFRAMCVVCHGAPGVDRGEFGQGITPTPPELSHAAEEFSTRELFWIVKNGIKLAGMPAFGPTHSDEEIWSIVSFIERLPEMTPEEYEAWGERQRAETGESRADERAGDPGTGDHAHPGGAATHEH